MNLENRLKKKKKKKEIDKKILRVYKSSMKDIGFKEQSSYLGLITTSSWYIICMSYSIKLGFMEWHGLYH